MSRIPVAVVGATGLAGQAVSSLSLAGPPISSKKSASSGSEPLGGQEYADAGKYDHGRLEFTAASRSRPSTLSSSFEDSAQLTPTAFRLVFSAV